MKRVKRGFVTVLLAVLVVVVLLVAVFSYSLLRNREETIRLGERETPVPTEIDNSGLREGESAIEKELEDTVVDFPDGEIDEMEDEAASL